MEFISQYFAIIDIFRKNLCEIQNDNNMRFRKTDMRDAMYFQAISSRAHYTQQEATNIINEKKSDLYGIDYCVDRKSLIYRNSYLTKDKLQKIDDELTYYITSYIKNKHMDRFIAIDGTYVNTYKETIGQKMEKHLLIGIYDATANVQLTLNKTKNMSERKGLMDDINILRENKDAIFILDGGYISDEILSMFYREKIKFVMRCPKGRNITKNIKSDDHESYTTIKGTKEYMRIITFNKKECKYHLATNLRSEVYNKQHILQIYRKRWDVETYFGFCKKNTNLDKIVTRNMNSINKIMLIISIITKMITFIRNIVSNELSYGYKINSTQLTNGFYDELLFDSLYNYNSINGVYLQNFIKKYVIKIKERKGRFFERKVKNYSTKCASNMAVNKFRKNINYIKDKEYSINIDRIINNQVDVVSVGINNNNLVDYSKLILDFR